MQITAENLRKQYGNVTALDGLSLEIPSGSTTGVLGTNGAGKTTLFKLLVGLDRPDGGRLLVGDETVAGACARLRKRIGYLPEHVGFPSSLTGREVLRFHARMRGLPNDGRISESIDTVGLSSRAVDRSIDGYSNGMRRRLGLAAVLVARPPVLVLDEPTAGLDPFGVAEFHRAVERVRESYESTVVLSSHALSEVERLCDRVAIIHDGRVAAAGSVDTLTESGSTTVTLRAGDPETVDTALDAVTGSAADHEVVSTGDGTITIRCPPGELPSLFAALDGRTALTDVDVDSPGLEAAFHEAIAPEGAL